MSNDAERVKSAVRMALGREIDDALARTAAARVAELAQAANYWLAAEAPDDNGPAETKRP